MSVLRPAAHPVGLMLQQPAPLAALLLLAPAPPHSYQRPPASHRPAASIGSQPGSEQLQPSLEPRTHADGNSSDVGIGGSHAAIPASAASAATPATINGAGSAKAHCNREAPAHAAWELHRVDNSCAGRVAPSPSADSDIVSDTWRAVE